MSTNNAPLPDPPIPMPTYPGFIHATKPDLSIGPCFVQCPNSASGALTVVFDVLDLRTGIGLCNLMAEFEKGVCNIFYGLDSQVKWSDCWPLEAMKMPCPPYTIAECCQREFEEALVEQLKQRIVKLYLVTEFESRFTEDFRHVIRVNDIDQNRTDW